LLNNHTTTRTRKFAESYGWKWENITHAPTIAGIYDVRTTPFNFLYGGYINSSFLYYAGAGGYLWSSVVESFGITYYLSFDSSAIYPSYGTDYYYGFSIRCLAR